MSLNNIKRIVVEIKLNKFNSVNWNLGRKTEKTMKKNYLNLISNGKVVGKYGNKCTRFVRH